VRLPRLDAAALLPTLALALLLAAYLILLNGCAHEPVQVQQPLVTIIPPDVDVERLVPPPAPEIHPGPDATKFPTEAIAGGRYCEPLSDGSQDCRELHAGFVLSETTYITAVQAKTSAERLAAEASALRKLRVTERAAVAAGEQAYWQRIKSLEAQNDAALRTQRLRFWLGLGLGVAVTAGVALGARQVAR